MKDADNVNELRLSTEELKIMKVSLLAMVPFLQQQVKELAEALMIDL
jgi:hypothetical protein